MRNTKSYLPEKSYNLCGNKNVFKFANAKQAFAAITIPSLYSDHFNAPNQAGRIQMNRR